MKWALGLAAGVAAGIVALRRLPPGIYGIGDARLADESPPGKPAVTAQRVRKCGDNEVDYSSFRIPYGRTEFLFASCTRNCCDEVTERLCDKDGKNCRDVTRYENCGKENCGMWLGFKVEPA